MAPPSVSRRAAVRRPVAIRVGPRSRVVIVMASFIGFVAFLWPFVVAPHAIGDAAMAPLMFGALLVLIIAVTGLSAELIAPYSPTANDFASMTEVEGVGGDRACPRPQGAAGKRGMDGDRADLPHRYPSAPTGAPVPPAAGDLDAREPGPRPEPVPLYAAP